MLVWWWFVCTSLLSNYFKHITISVLQDLCKMLARLRKERELEIAAVVLFNFQTISHFWCLTFTWGLGEFWEPSSPWRLQQINLQGFISASPRAPKTPALHTEPCASPRLRSVICCSSEKSNSEARSAGPVWRKRKQQRVAADLKVCMSMQMSSEIRFMWLGGLNFSGRPRSPSVKVLHR